ncbi:hypothetical protein SmJEL517_g00597 [Synchytrium microbalum]|uniref:SYO1-like TPR repeats domain-containing protein n=1 Tax=Synchytrium microbalum TaxID=1806994 RepID=A0A507C7T6_9FUNG|nr:uncharacterized protein SmJEL517_g00597 [Synchytrium microbalum]TPX37640.1 hypothetical protein SmJEL517_g00597 [Synchytrium microbalum]
MTKSKKQTRYKRSRPSPLSTKTGAAASAASSFIENELPLDNAANQQTIPILKKLSSLDVDDRAWTASAIAHLAAENPQTRQLMLANNVIGELSKAMADPNPEVAVEIIGALRNLALDDEVSVLEEMMKKNVFDLLLSHLNRIAQTITPCSTVDASLHDNSKEIPLYRLAEQCLLLLQLFIETLEGALSAVTSSPPILAFMVSTSFPSRKIPIPVIKASLQCLNVLTDDSENTLLSISLHTSHPDLIASLMEVAASGASQPDNQSFSVYDDENRMMVRVLAASIVYNVASATSTSTLSSRSQVMMNAVIPATTSALSSLDVAVTLAKAVELEQEFQVDVVSKAPVTPQTTEDGDMQMGHDHDEEVATSTKVLKAQTAIAILESHFLTVHYALEVLANALGDDVNQRGWEDVNGDQDDVDPMDAAVEEEEDSQESDSAAFITQIMTSTAPSLFPLLAQLSQIESSTTIIPASLAASVQGTRVRALSCLETLTMGVDKSWFASQSSSDIATMWTWLIDIANRTTSNTSNSAVAPVVDLEALEGAVGIMWAMSRGISGLKMDIPYTNQQLDALIALCTTATNPPSLIIKSLHVLSLLVNRPDRIPENRQVGLLLLALIAGSPSTEVVFEALDAIFDVYSDASFDYDEPVFVGCDFLRRLKDSVQAVRVKIKGVDRKRDGTLYARGREALDNLVAFIQYKESERAAASR